MGVPLPDQREQSGNPVSMVRSDPRLSTFLFNFFIRSCAGFAINWLSWFRHGVSFLVERVDQPGQREFGRLDLSAVYHFLHPLIRSSSAIPGSVSVVTDDANVHDK